MPTLNNVITATITLYKIEEVSLYQAELISTNGNIFHSYDINTDLYFRVFLNNEDITSNFNDIEWVKFSQDKDQIIEDQNWGYIYQGNPSISLSREDVGSKCIIQANAYAMIKNIRTCVASARITLIDVNDIYSNTEPPDNPTEGSLWINTSYNPPIIFSWNSTSNKWVEVSKTTPFVRNLIHNSNFWRLNTENYVEDNIESLYPIRIINNNNKEWALLKSRKQTQKDVSAGLFQTTTYPLVKNSDYCFSFLAYTSNSTIYNGKNIYCKIISIDELGENEIILATNISISTDQEVQISIPFKTLNDTESIKCFIGVEPEKMCEYYITQLSLYNTKSYYPWELAPEDVQLQLDNKINNDHLSVFNALTRNGLMEGIYIRKDENGNEHFYFNASHIKTGSIDGGLINGIGLNIKDEATGESIFHVYKDENGTHIDLIANNLLIGQSRETASTINYVDTTTKKAEDNAIATAGSYTDGQITEVNKVVDTKADNTTVDAIDERLSTIEIITEDEAIVGTVTGSEVYSSMLESNEQKFNKHAELIDDLSKELDAIEKDIEDNIKVNIQPNQIINIVTNSKKYKDDLDTKVDNTNFETYKKDSSDYLNSIVSSINTELGKKATNEKVNGIDSRVSTLESNTTAASIVSTVRNSQDYKNDLNAKVNNTDFNTYKNNMDSYKEEIQDDLDSKVDSSKIILEINSSTETELINKTKIDFDSELTLSRIYTSDGINIDNRTFIPTTITIDNIIDNIDFTVDGTDITMQVYDIRNTNYIRVFNNDANIYMNNNEMIKLLLYEIKNLRQRITDLENNNEGGE